ncbi:hypothetical protein [Arthrobacter sp. AL12]|uniref:hypothetical protein n=1 Tax=Arthrobacter sp. AL12 TaxID=3042241 RepID=UPI00249CC398|nr:hypothetical protein [Arthrobacter sp. AL12]MDI3213231.1 hypothetical protein [Arthrobacter sp. AL12]
MSFDRPLLGAYAVTVKDGICDPLPLMALVGRTEPWLVVAASLITLTPMLWHPWVTLVRPGR